MHEDLINLIMCPKCNGDIEIKKIIEIMELKNIKFLHAGLLKCKRCNSLYPIIDRIPRMLKDEELLQSEKKTITDYRKLPFKKPKLIVKTVISEDEKFKIIEKLVKEKIQLKFKSIESEKISERWKSAINYLVYQTEKKERFVNTSIPYLSQKPEVIADIGGGQGGAIGCFSRYFTPRLSILIDLDIQWAKIALIRDSTLNVVRANAVNIPFKNQSIDFLISKDTLEHISLWEKTIEEIARVSKNAFVSYSPNKWAFYDWWHVKAPMVTVLPKRMGACIAYLFHKLIRTGYPYNLIKNELENTHYISRFKAVKVLEKFGTVKNVFSEFLYHSVRSDSYFDFGRLKPFLISHPRFLTFFSNFAVMLGTEPQVYLFFKASRHVKYLN